MLYITKIVIDVIEIAFFLGLAGSFVVVTLTVLDDLRNIFRDD
ncbi:MAG TPA: hypothetical protein VG844_10520 [Terracidiphilus sp.]|nr:hypothetical protein [Terracidiphilus sp.]